jgi:hypothetical protein
MQGPVEIIRIVDGHLFDVECYERTASMAVSCDRAAGYYVVSWPKEARNARFDSGAIFLGPYATAEEATSIARRAET